LDDAAAPALASQHSLREPADDGQAIGVDVEEGDLVDVEAVCATGESVDKLRRVGAAAADDRQLQAQSELRLAKLLITLSALPRRARGPTTTAQPVPHRSREVSPSRWP